MPAAAVIPAPIAYINIVAVKTLVVGFLVWRAQPWTNRFGVLAHFDHPSRETSELFTESWARPRSFTLKKLECSKQAYAVNTLAWNNEIGLWSYFVGF